MNFSIIVTRFFLFQGWSMEFVASNSRFDRFAAGGDGDWELLPSLICPWVSISLGIPSASSYRVQVNQVFSSSVPQMNTHLRLTRIGRGTRLTVLDLFAAFLLQSAIGWLGDFFLFQDIKQKSCFTRCSLFDARVAFKSCFSTIVIHDESWYTTNLK